MTETVVKYQDYRHYIDSGDVILWHGDTLLGWLIRKFSQADVNHTSTVIRTNELGSDRIFITEANARGIEVHALSDRLAEHKGQAYWLRLKTEHDLSRYGARKWALDHIDIGYDYSALFRQICGKVTANSKRLFCSEFSFLALKLGGAIKKLEYKIEAPQPGNMESLGIFNERVRIK